MLLKYGVNPIFSKYVTDIFHILDEVYQRHTGRECIITGGNDGRHNKGSIHYELKEYRGTDHVLRKESGAFDARIRDISRQTAKNITQVLKIKLPDFDIILEKDHIHGEYDPH